MQKLLSLYKAYFLDSQNIYKFLLTFLLVFIPLFPKFPAFRLAGTYVSIRLEDFLILITLLVFSVPLIKNFKSILKNNIVRAILVFLFVGLVSSISGIFITQTTSASLAFLHLFRRVEYLSLFFVGFIYMKYINEDKNIFEYLFKVLVIINLVIFLYGLGQRYLSFPVVTTQNEEYSKGIALRWVPGAHINSTFAGHYDLASYLVLTIPIFVVLFFLNKDRLSKIIFGISILFGFWLLSSAVSRISIVAFLLASSIPLLIYKKYKNLLVFGAISVILFGFSPDLRARYGRIIEVVKEKISQSLTVYADEGEVFEDRSTSIRLNVEWPRAIRALIKNPLLGTGYSSITLATDNDYLRALGETGILGLLSFILIFLCIWSGNRNLIINDGFESIYRLSILGSTVAILLTAVFIDIFEASKFATMFWLLSGISIGSQKSI